MSQWKLTNDTDKIWLLRAQNVWWSVLEGTKLENIDLPCVFEMKIAICMYQNYNHQPSFASDGIQYTVQNLAWPTQSL